MFEFKECVCRDGAKQDQEREQEATPNNMTHQFGVGGGVRPICLWMAEGPVREARALQGPARVVVVPAHVARGGRWGAERRAREDTGYKKTKGDSGNEE